MHSQTIHTPFRVKIQTLREWHMNLIAAGAGGAGEFGTPTN